MLRKWPGFRVRPGLTSTFGVAKSISWFFLTIGFRVAWYGVKLTFKCLRLPLVCCCRRRGNDRKESRWFLNAGCGYFYDSTSGSTYPAPSNVHINTAGQIVGSGECIIQHDASVARDHCGESCLSESPEHSVQYAKLGRGEVLIYAANDYFVGCGIVLKSGLGEVVLVLPRHMLEEVDKIQVIGKSRHERPSSRCWLSTCDARFNALGRPFDRKMDDCTYADIAAFPLSDLDVLTIGVKALPPHLTSVKYDHQVASIRTSANKSGPLCQVVVEETGTIPPAEEIVHNRGIALASMQSRPGFSGASGRDLVVVLDGNEMRRQCLHTYSQHLSLIHI